MSTLRPHVTCPLCGAPAVRCRVVGSGYVLAEHYRPVVGVGTRTQCTEGSGHAVTPAAVLAWVAGEEQFVGVQVLHYEVEVRAAQDRLTKARGEAREKRAQLEKIAAKAKRAKGEGR